MTQIALDGELLRIKQCKIDLSQQLAEQDSSGQTSATSSTEQGDKAKVLTVTGIVPFADKVMLTRLFELATEKDTVGHRKVRRVSSDISKAVKIRQVKFFGTISAPSHYSLKAWNISFQLREHLSVAEVAETRRQVEKAEAEQTTENTTSPVTSEPVSQGDEETKVASSNAFLRWLDNSLADKPEETEAA
ncbi:MAG: DNA-binding protein [Parashewanella sp.]